MYQVTFSDQSAAVMESLPHERQLQLIDALSRLSPSFLSAAQEPVGRFLKAEITYYRYRVEDYRFYFTLNEEKIHCIYILHKNTWADFRLRNNLEKISDSEVEAKPNFFKLLEHEK